MRRTELQSAPTNHGGFQITNQMAEPTMSTRLMSKRRHQRHLVAPALGFSRTWCARWGSFGSTWG
jgi:hypothetical protein